MRLHHLGVDELLRTLHTGPDGLGEDEADRRLAEYGPNRVEVRPSRRFITRVLAQFTHFFALVLWVAAALAVAAEFWRGGEGMGVLAVAIVAVILINGLFSLWQEYKSEHAVEALQGLLPHLSMVVRNAGIHEIPVEALVPGDIVVLEGGDSVPADCRIIAAAGVQANIAAVTGESAPVLRDAHPSEEHDLVSSRNVLLAGTVLTAGEARAVVFATGMHTVFGNIAHLTRTQGETLSPLQKEVTRLSRLIAALAVGLGAVFLFIGQATGMKLWDSSLFAIGIIVANVPEGLLPTVTLALAMGAQRLARRKMLVRHLNAVEALGAVTVICTDKTGTLTENRMVPESAYIHGQIARGSELKRLGETAPALADAIRHCHSLKQVIGPAEAHITGDATEAALLSLTGDALGRQQLLDEIPFDPERKRMSTLHADAGGRVLYTKGALETVLPLCTGIDGRTIDDNTRAAIREAEAHMAVLGLRVLAFACRRISGEQPRELLEQELEFLGLLGLNDPIRREVPEAVARCRGAGIRTIMITGDHPLTARAVAEQADLGGPGGEVLSGSDLQKMSDTQLQLALDRPSIIFARTRVDQKRRIVAALQKKGEIVAVTGDGVNDAPALRQADVGISMGVGGTDVAREAADMIMVDDNFATIVAAVEEGRAVFDNIRKFLGYILTSNIPEIVPFLAFVLLDVPLALTVVQILAVDLGTDMVPALALAAEKPHSDVMQRPPRRRDQRLTDWPLIRRAYLLRGPSQAFAGMAAFFFVLSEYGWTYGSLLPSETAYHQATTACLAAIVVAQVANLFLSRSERLSAFTPETAPNPMIPVGIVVELMVIAVIVYLPLGNLLFETAPLPLNVWALAALFTVPLIFADEVYKAMARVRGSASRWPASRMR